MEAKKKKKIIISIIAVMALLIVILSTVLIVNNVDKGEVKVEIIVYHPITGDVIKEHETIYVKYTGEPIPIRFQLKLKSKDYPEISEKDVFVSIRPRVINENDTDNIRYITDIGRYDIILDFDASILDCAGSNKYFKSIERKDFRFSITIEE